jgi:hypothetical protein
MEGAPSATSSWRTSNKWQVAAHRHTVPSSPHGVVIATRCRHRHTVSSSPHGAVSRTLNAGCLGECT